MSRFFAALTALILQTLERAPAPALSLANILHISDRLRFEALEADRVAMI